MFILRTVSEDTRFKPVETQVTNTFLGSYYEVIKFGSVQFEDLWKEFGLNDLFPALNGQYRSPKGAEEDAEEEASIKANVFFIFAPDRYIGGDGIQTKTTIHHKKTWSKTDGPIEDRPCTHYSHYIMTDSGKTFEKL